MSSTQHGAPPCDAQTCYALTFAAMPASLTLTSPPTSPRLATKFPLPHHPAAHDYAAAATRPSSPHVTTALLHLSLSVSLVIITAYWQRRLTTPRGWRAARQQHRRAIDSSLMPFFFNNNRTMVAVAVSAVAVTCAAHTVRGRRVRPGHCFAPRMDKRENSVAGVDLCANAWRHASNARYHSRRGSGMLRC